MQESNTSPTEGTPISEGEAIARLRQTEDMANRYYAAWWLGRMRSRHPEAVPLLCQALHRISSLEPETGPEQGHGRGHEKGVDAKAIAMNAARALGRMNAQASIPDLLDVLDADDYRLREVAAQALGDLKAAAAVPALTNRLASGTNGAGKPSSEGSPQLNEPCEAMLEALGEIGNSSAEIIAIITPFSNHERPLIKSAACRALLQLTEDNSWAMSIEKLLNHPQALVRRGALIDLGAVGWLPALKAINETQVENSLKLIALKGLAEHGRPSRMTPTHNIPVLEAMDALL